MKKYTLRTDLTTTEYHHTLYRIQALTDFADIKAGDLGGYIEKEDNLSQEGHAWIYDNAKVYDNALVFGNTKVYDNALVFGNTQVYGYARVFGDAKVFGHTQVYGYARVFGDAKVYGHTLVCDNAKVFGYAEVFGEATIKGNAQIQDSSGYIVFKNWWSSGRYFTWTRTNNMWAVGCFYGTAEELIHKALQEDPQKAKEYQRVIDYVNSILQDEPAQHPSPYTMKKLNHKPLANIAGLCIIKHTQWQELYTQRNQALTEAKAYQELYHNALEAKQPLKAQIKELEQYLKHLLALYDRQREELQKLKTNTNNKR